LEARIRQLALAEGFSDSPERLAELSEAVAQLRGQEPRPQSPDHLGFPDESDQSDQSDESDRWDRSHQRGEPDRSASPDQRAGVWLEGFLHGRFPEEIPDGPHAAALRGLSAQLRAARDFAVALARGDLSAELNARGTLAGSLKSLQASLRHLTWQTRAIADGNLDIRVDFMGEFSTAFNTMVQKLREAQETLNRRNAELDRARTSAEAASQAKSDFLANVTHEIRTPMNIILGFTEVMAAEVADPRHREFLRAMDASGRLLLTLINDILDLSRVEAGKLTLTPVPTDLRQVIREIARLFEARGAEKGVRIAAEVAPVVPAAVTLDADRLRQILVNLVGNAVKFTPEGEVRIAVDGKMTAEDRLDLTVTVRDTGPGIPASERERVFEPFVQRPETAGGMGGEAEGAGLGLAIARRLVRLMGGSVNVGEAPGGGALFTLVFRDVPAARPGAAANAGDETESAGKVRFRGGTVLVGDDVAMNRRMLQAMLAAVGVAAIEAEGGEAVLEKARALRPDLVLLDLRMPDRDGLSVARELRDDPATRDIPLVAVTATIQGERRDAAREVFDGVLVKPVRWRELNELVARHLPLAEPAPNLAPPPEPPPGPALPPGAALRLDRLAELLEADLLPEWRRLTEVMVVGEVEDFARRIRELGLRYRCEPVRVWGEQLARRADSVDVPAIRQSLERFPEVIEALRELLADWPPDGGPESAG
jgi:signal transduction histidine kinase